MENEIELVKKAEEISKGLKRLSKKAEKLFCLTIALMI